MAEPVDASNVLGSLRNQADKAAGINPTAYQPGEGIAAGLEELAAKAGEQPFKKDSEYANRQSIIDSAISGTKKTFVFGISLADLFQKNIRSIVGRTVHYFFDHKTEIIFGGLAGGAAKAALRVWLAGSGGWVASAAIGAAGGILSGGAKEYIRQSKEIPLTDEDRKLIIGFFINEYRKFPEIKKGEIVMAGLKGAVAGAAGGVIGAEIANNVWVQEQVAKIPIPKFGGPSAGRPAVEATPTPKTSLAGVTKESPVPTKTPEPVAIQTATPVPTSTPIPSAPDVEAQPPVKIPPVESISLKTGSNPSSEMYAYLEQQFGRPPQALEVKEAVTRFMEENNITDATRIPADKPFSIQSVNEYVKEIAGGQPEAGLEITSLPEEIPLPEGSNPWNEVSDIGGKYLGRELTNQEIMHLTKVLCKDSGISVPIWDLNEGVDHVKLRIGFPLKVKGVYKILEQMKSATALPDAA